MPNTPDNFEYIFDFMLLFEESYAENGYEVLHFEFDKPILHCCLRRTLRNLGYKIIKKKYHPNTVSYFTNIPTDKLREWIQFYNENRYTEEYSCNSDTPDSDSDNDSPENDNQNY